MNLYCKKTISLKEALCGFSIELLHLNGKTLRLNNKKQGNIIYPGFKRELPGFGFTRKGESGMLILEFDVSFPTELDENKKVRVNLPVRTTGVAKGVLNGGRLNMAFRTLSCYGLAKDIPEAIVLDISPIRIGQGIKISEINMPGVTFLDPAFAMVVSVKISRGAIDDEEEEEEEEGAEGEEEEEAAEEEKEEKEEGKEEKKSSSFLCCYKKKQQANH